MLVQSLKSLKREEKISTKKRDDDDDARRKPIARKFSRLRCSVSQARNSEIEYKWKELSKVETVSSVSHSKFINCRAW